MFLCYVVASCDAVCTSIFIELYLILLRWHGQHIQRSMRAPHATYCMVNLTDLRRCTLDR